MNTKKLCTAAHAERDQFELAFNAIIREAVRDANIKMIHVDGCVLIAWPNTPDHWTVYRSSVLKTCVLCRFANSWELHEANRNKGKGALLQRYATRAAALRSVK